MCTRASRDISAIPVFRLDGVGRVSDVSVGWQRNVLMFVLLNLNVEGDNFREFAVILIL